MKTVTRFLSFGIFFACVLLWSSCEKTESVQKGKIEFALDLTRETHKSDSPESKDSSNIHHSWHIQLSIKNDKGEFVMEDEIIPLLVFGNGYITGKIEMAAGNFDLTKFLVIGPEGEIVYAAPRGGSPKAFLVDDSLPVSFIIRPGETTRIIPQVLPTHNAYPDDFGYASFGFDIVRPVIAYVGVIADNPINLSPSSMVSAQMTVFTPDGQIVKYGLKPKINRILLKPGYKILHVIVEKPGYPSIDRDIRMKVFKNTTPDDPYIFKLSKDTLERVIIQPGPEEGKDAMVTDLDPLDNFGDYHYFEASFLTESPLTVMRTKRSLIEFDLSDLPKSAKIESVKLILHFDTFVWDSLHKTSPEHIDPNGKKLVFRQIVEPWNEDEVTWDNQPKSIEANQVIVERHPELSSNQRVYDITSLFVPVQEIAAPNHGFIFMHADEENPFPGGLKFASSDYPRENMRPKLVIKYSCASK